ncbi:hypothetical protein PUN28_010572 [Cardiocondyla obscurior]|uniref:Uncharacterized protein n=1 Tax=Cardiocondyla obscurior TaxID=286306 RepID=A0AAW2FK79_9HYME
MSFPISVYCSVRGAVELTSNCMCDE